ncbi:PAS domain S-box protein, partial [archaeon]|nr:PAS domain S-box protein [archaeon]
MKGNIALKKKKDSLKDSEHSPDYYCRVCDHFPDAVFVENQDGRIMECNASALEMFGYTREEMIGLRGRDLFPDEVGNEIPTYLDEVNTTGGIFVWISSRKKNGTVFPALYSTQVVSLDGVPHILAIIRKSGDRYYFLNPAASPRSSTIGTTAEYPGLSLTWEMRGTSLVLVGYDDRTMESTG